MFWRKAAVVFPLQADFPVFNQTSALCPLFSQAVVQACQGSTKSWQMLPCQCSLTGPYFIEQGRFSFWKRGFPHSITDGRLCTIVASSGLHFMARRLRAVWFTVQCRDALLLRPPVTLSQMWAFPCFSLSGECVSCYCEDNAFGHKGFILVDPWKERTRKRSGDPAPSGVPWSRTHPAPYPMPKMKT